MKPVNLLDLKERYLLAVKDIVEGRQTIFQCLSIAEELIKSGAVDLTNNHNQDIIWNDMGQFFYKHGLFSDCEYFNEHLLQVLRKYDLKCKIPRGQALYNLGIAQINQRNFDQGIPNVLNALLEDVKLYGEQKASKMRATLVREQLYSFSASIIDRIFIPELKQSIQFNSQKKTTTSDILNVLPDIADRLLLAKCINIYYNITFRDDNYSKILMFDNLKTLCLLFEHSLHIKGKGSSSKPLVDSLFIKESWWTNFNTNYQLTQFRDDSTSNALQKFEDNLLQIKNMFHKNVNQDVFLTAAFLESVILRNLTAHLFDLNVSILNNDSEYRQAFTTVMSCLLYSLHFQS